MKTKDKYLKLVEWSDEDKCYIGTCPGLMLGGVHGDDEIKVYKELCQVVDEWIAVFKKDKRPLPKPTALENYSGKFVLRIGSELHKLLHIAALKNKTSINNFCQKTLARYLGAS